MKDLFKEDVAVANHADLRPISTSWEASGHDLDEGVLRQALLAKQAADLRVAQRDGWIPPLPRLGTLLPCLAPADGRSEGVSEGRPGGTLSTATSGLSAMDTDEGSAEMAAAAAAALASQEERAAAEAAAAAARQARREARRAEKEARRQKLLQEKREAKARARAEAQRRFAEQLQRWEAAVADKRQQVADLQQQAAQAEDGIRAAEERAKALEERKHAMFLQLKKALDEEQAEKQRKQQLAAMEEGEVATSPPLSARGTGAGAPPPAAGVRSPSFAQPYHSGGPGAPHGFGPLGPLGPKVPGEPGGGYGSGAAYGGGAAGGGFYGGRGPAAGPAGGGGELWEDSRTRDAWGTSGGAPGSTGSTPRGHREGLGPALGLGGGGTPLAGEREWERGGDFGWRAGGDYRGGPPGGGSAGRDRAWRGGFDDRRLPPREFSRDFPPGGGASRDGAGPGPLAREFSSSRDGLGPPGALSREHSMGGSRGFSPPRYGAPPAGREGGGPGRPRLNYEERERLRHQQRDGEGGPAGERPPYGGSREAWEHGSSREGFPAGFGGGGGSRGGWAPGSGREREREREGGRGGSVYREPPQGR